MHIYDNHGYDSRFICFSCGAQGDVIDFTAKLFGISKKEAVDKLSADFGLAEPSTAFSDYRTEHQRHQAKVQYALRCVDFRLQQLLRWKETYCPHTVEDTPHPNFVCYLQDYEKLRYYREILQNGTREEQSILIKQIKEELQQYDRIKCQQHRDERHSDAAVVGRA
jgi:hypothetical protein